MRRSRTGKSRSNGLVWGDMAMVRRNQELDLYQLMQTVLEELELPDYMYFVVMSLAIDDAIISTLPIIENMMKDKRWVIVMGEKSCVLKFIKDITLGKKMAFIHDMPFTLLVIIDKNDINQKLFMQYSISYDEWREMQYIVVQSRKEMCHVQFFDELSFDFNIKKLSLFNAIRYMYQMIRSTKIVCCFFDIDFDIDCDIDIDNAINDIKKKMQSNDFLTLIGPSWDIEPEAYASLVLCNATPTIYRIYKPPFTSISVALVKKCKAYFEHYNERELSEKLTEEGFNRLRAILYTDVYKDNEGRVHLEGVTYYSDDSIDSVIETIKQLCSMDEQ